MCSICYGEGNEYTITISCGHDFHINCLTKWWETKDGYANCPMCRREQGQEEFDYVWMRHFAFMYLKKKHEGDYHFRKWIRLLKIYRRCFETSLEELLDAGEFIPQSVKPCK